MTGQRSVAELADVAAEAIRSLNHATFPGAASTPGGLAWPSDVYDVLASLSVLAARLPQLLAQLDGFVTRAVDAGRIVVDGGQFAGDPQAAAATASHWLEHAASLAAQLGHTVDQAQQAVAFLADDGE